MTPTVGLADILVLAVGNQLLSDDGVGMSLLDGLSRDARWEDRVEFVDGGTQGLALLGHLSGRRALIVLDAVASGAAPGTVHVAQWGGRSTCGWISKRHASTSHESSALDLLRFAALIGELPEQVWIVGIEPERLNTGIGLSKAVCAAVPRALREVKQLLQELCRDVPCHTR